MANPEKIPVTPEFPHLEKAYSILERAEREIQKECLETGQPWINGFITQWNVLMGQLSLAELFGEITQEELERLRENNERIKEIIDGEGGLREKYNKENILIPQDEKETLLGLLDVGSEIKKILEEKMTLS